LWSISRRTTFNYVWIMEEDVHYTNISLLTTVLAAPLPADLLHHDPLNETYSDWPHTERVRMQANGVFGDSPMYCSMLNLYRMSTATLGALDEIYRLNNKTWVFFEALIPTTVLRFNLTHDEWTAGDPSLYNFRYEPCFTEFKTEGIYHPAKFDGRGFRKCRERNRSGRLAKSHP
jgi:hypothetical protein